VRVPSPVTDDSGAGSRQCTRAGSPTFSRMLAGSEPSLRSKLRCWSRSISWRSSASRSSSAFLRAVSLARASKSRAWFAMLCVCHPFLFKNLSDIAAWHQSRLCSRIGVLNWIGPLGET
jgi:hypothetical protein